MEFAGYLGADAPDPAVARTATIEALGIPVAGLVPQRHLEERGEIGVATTGAAGAGRPDAVTVARTYLLWRNPDDRDDPANLAELDAVTERSLAAPLERPLPPWLMAAREAMRYPRLWEAVQTHWWRPGEERRPLAELLVSHAEYILTNRFAEQLGLVWPEWTAPIPVHALQPHETLVDGAARTGLLLDTDPFVLALGVELDDGRVLTAVIPRDDLPFVTLEFASDLPLT